MQVAENEGEMVDYFKEKLYKCQFLCCHPVWYDSPGKITFSGRQNEALLSEALLQQMALHLLELAERLQKLVEMWLALPLWFSSQNNPATNMTKPNKPPTL